MISPKTRSPQTIIALIGIGTALSLLGDATLYTVLPNPEIATQLGINMAMVGVLLGINRGTRLILNSPIGALYDRLPRRALLVSSLFLGAIASVLYALSTGFWLLLIGRIVWGTAWSLLWLGATSVVLDISNDENRARFSGRFQMWRIIGIAFSSFFGAFFTDLFGFRGGQWLSASLILFGMLLWYFLLPETRQVTTKATAIPFRQVFSGVFPWAKTIRIAFPLFIIRFVSWGVLGATPILWLAGLVDDGLTFRELIIPIATLTGIYKALSMLPSIGGARLAGWLSDHLKRRWVIMGGGLGIGAIGILLMSYPLLGIALLGAFLTPLAGSAVETLIPAVTGDQIDVGMRGQVLGMIYTLGDLGATVGPMITLGLLNNNTLSLPVIYQASAGLLGLAGLFAWMEVRKERIK